MTLSIMTQYNDTQYNDTQYNGTQYNDIQYNITQYNDTQHNGSFVMLGVKARPFFLNAIMLSTVTLIVVAPFEVRCLIVRVVINI